MPDPRVGRRLGDCTLQDYAGRSGPASVYRAVQAPLNRPVRVHVLDSGAGDPGRLARIARLEHPNLVPVYAAGVEDGCAWWAEREVEGAPLAPTLPPGDYLRALADAVSGLAAAHAAGLVHGAIGAGAVLVADDTGLLRGFGPSAAKATTADDLEAVGLLLSELPSRSIPPEASTRLESIVTRALERSYSGAAELERELRSLRLPSGPAPQPATARTVIRDDAPEPAPGRPSAPKTFGKYVLRGSLGHGGMGMVFRAEDPGLGREVALKVLIGDGDLDAEALARFNREVRAVAALRHPNLVPIHEFGEVDGKHYFTMDLVDGGDLSDRKLPPRRAAEVVRDAARAVHYAHSKGLVHRDLKPANLMVDSADRVYVMDFGLARSTRLDDKKVSRSGLVVGTPAFMAPEQARGLRTLDARADVWSLGATLQSLLTGSPPFDGEGAADVVMKVVNDDPAPLPASIPRDLRHVVGKCLEKDPARRYESAAALADDLEAWLLGEPVRARAPSMIRRLVHAIRRRKVLAAAVAACLVGVAVPAAILLPKWKGEAEARKKSEDEGARKTRAEDAARPFLEAGRRRLEELRVYRRSPDHDPGKLWELAGAAEAEFRKALEARADHPEAWVGIARARLILRDFPKALEPLDRAIAAAPEFGPAYLDRARARLGDLAFEAVTVSGTVTDSPRVRELREAAGRDLAAARRSLRDPSELQLAEGMLRYSKGEFAPAAEALGAYLATTPTDVDAWFWRACCLERIDRNAEAREAVRQAQSLDPNFISTWELLGTISTSERDYEGAIAAYSRVLELKRRHPIALIGRALAYMYLDRNREALEDARASLEIRETAEGHACMADALKDLGRLDEAERSARRAVEVDGRNPMALNVLGMVLGARGRFQDALAPLDLAIEIDPRFLMAYVARGIARRMTKDLDGALADFTKVIELNAKSDLGYGNRANIHADRGDFPAAVADLDVAIRLNPRSVPLFANRGTYRERLQDWSGAMEDWNAALALKPDSPDWLLRRGLLHERLKDLPAARADAARALEVAPPNWPYRRTLEELNRRLAQ